MIIEAFLKNCFLLIALLNFLVVAVVDVEVVVDVDIGGLGLAGAQQPQQVQELRVGRAGAGDRTRGGAGRGCWLRGGGCTGLLVAAVRTVLHSVTLEEDRDTFVNLQIETSAWKPVIRIHSLALACRCRWFWICCGGTIFLITPVNAVPLAVADPGGGDAAVVSAQEPGRPLLAGEAPGVREVEWSWRCYGGAILLISSVNTIRLAVTNPGEGDADAVTALQPGTRWFWFWLSYRGFWWWCR